MDFQSSNENGWICRKNTAAPMPATLTKSWSSKPLPSPLTESMNGSKLLLWLLLEKKQRGRSSCWAWSQSIASIFCWIGTFKHQLQDLHQPSELGFWNLLFTRERPIFYDFASKPLDFDVFATLDQYYVILRMWFHRFIPFKFFYESSWLH